MVRYAPSYLSAEQLPHPFRQAIPPPWGKLAHDTNGVAAEATPHQSPSRVVKRLLIDFLTKALREIAQMEKITKFTIGLPDLLYQGDC